MPFPDLANPVLVDVIRGGRVESTHRGAYAVVDAAGRVLAQAGDIGRPHYPRSAVKVIQALALVESGAADRFGLDDRHLALACASHGGEPAHVELAAEMLRRAGRGADDLECGAHWPMYQPAANDLLRGGLKPCALHNNCSGKHAGFICVACAMDEAPKSYVDPAHPVQREVKAALEQVTGFALAEGSHGTDGCAAPTWALPLQAMAHGFARLATGQGLQPVRQNAARRLFHACMAQGFFVAGTGRFDTTIMAAGNGRIFVKTGAEGIYCAALPDQGIGLALQIDDGATRASEVVMAALIARHLSDAPLEALARYTDQTLSNWNGTPVGAMRPSSLLA
jgi:L-asparaginase II